LVRRLFFAVLSVGAVVATASVAYGSTASVAITGGGLSLANPSVRVIGQDPTRLEVSTSVIDARGTGAGWFLSLGAVAPSDTTANTMVVTGARSGCEPDSACTLPDSDIAYPLSLRVNGGRGWVFEAEPSSGLGTQNVEVFVTVPPGVAEPLDLSFSVSTQPPGGSDSAAPASSGAVVPQYPPCSAYQMLTTDSCRTSP
jgi:hypothetical protein